MFSAWELPLFDKYIKSVFVHWASCALVDERQSSLRCDKVNKHPFPLLTVLTQLLQLFHPFVAALRGFGKCLIYMLICLFSV